MHCHPKNPQEVTVSCKFYLYSWIFRTAPFHQFSNHSAIKVVTNPIVQLSFALRLLHFPNDSSSKYPLFLRLLCISNSFLESFLPLKTCCFWFPNLANFQADRVAAAPQPHRVGSRVLLRSLLCALFYTKLVKLGLFYQYIDDREL